jgi:hypothetical protein
MFPLLTSLLAPATSLVAALALAPAPPAPHFTTWDWHTFDSAASPGSPATITLDPVDSTATDSFFDIHIPGYWSRVADPGDGSTYMQIDVPGLGSLAVEGAPDLPAARVRIALPTDAPVLDVVSAYDLDPRLVPNTLLYPYEIEAKDGGPDGSGEGMPAVFVKDGAIYGGTNAYPEDRTFPTEIVSMAMGSVPFAEVDVAMGSWDPTTGDLLLSAHTRVHTHAAGSQVPQLPLSKESAKLAKSSFLNWPEVDDLFPVETGGYAGRYLIVVNEWLLDELDPFILHKTLQGFSVDVLLMESLANPFCFDLKTAIGDWYQLGSPNAEHYALLVGDHPAIPLCGAVVPAAPLTDDAYGSPLDGDLDEEIYVGRLSVDGPSDLTLQLDKIMEYDLTGGDQHGRALLVAHEENAPGKYEGAHEVVRTASYDVQPDFTPVYGSGSTGLANNDVVEQELEFFEGQGLVAYRGHGGSDNWWDWNGYQNFELEDMDEVYKKDVHSVMWSFSCWNNRIDWTPFGDMLGDSIGEAWMEKAHGGAVAHYGSTDVSSTKQNHLLDKYMFEAVFNEGLTRHGHAIAWAEAKMHAERPGANSWMYNLLGDASMRVKRGGFKDLVANMPDSVAAGGSGTGAPDLVVEVLDDAGVPQEGALVTVYAPAPVGGEETFVNAYTDADGQATFWTLVTSVQYPYQIGITDDEGNHLFATLPVSDGPWTNVGGALAGLNGDSVLLGQGSLQPNSPVSVDLTDGRESAIAVLFGSIGSTPVPFKGGTLLAYPWALFLDLQTDAVGELHLATTWPAGVPVGTDLMFQVAMQDDGAIHGVSLSNGLAAVTP